MLRESLSKEEQGKKGRGRAARSRAGQGRAGQGIEAQQGSFAGLSKALRQGRAGQGRAGHSIETQLSTAYPSKTEAGPRAGLSAAKQVTLCTMTSLVTHIIASSCSM